MRVSKDERDFQLQLFNGREYQTIANGPREVLEKAPDWMLGVVARRIVLTTKERALRPRYVVPRGPHYTHTAETVRARYAKWAKAKGLSLITAWSGKAAPQGGFGVGVSVRYVHPDTFHAVTEEHDLAEAA